MNRHGSAMFAFKGLACSFFLTIALITVGPRIANASGFDCNPNPTPDTSSAYFTYGGPEYSASNLLSLGFSSISTSSAGYYIDVRVYDDACNLVVPVSPGGVPISSSVTSVHVRFVSATEFDIVDDATNAVLFRNTFSDVPPYVRVVVRIRSDFSTDADILDTAPLTLQDGATPPGIDGQAISINPTCPSRSVGHGRYTDYFDGNYEKSVYTNGLLRVQLRLTGLGLLGDAIQEMGAEPRDAGCNLMPPLSEPAVSLNQLRYSRYFSFRMSDPTHWQLWDDDHEVPITCVGCSGMVSSGASFVSFVVYNQGDIIFPHYIYTTPYPPTEAGHCFTDCNSNVLFLPGIEASRLYIPAGKVWEPSSNTSVQQLFLDPSGESVRSDIYTKKNDVVDELPVTGVNIYKSFLDRMESLKSTGKINDWEAVPYDWRLSLDDIINRGTDSNGNINYSDRTLATSTPYLVQELRRLAATSRTGKVTIVAHSNGGLVAKRLTEVLGPDASSLIDTIILVAVPQAGTPLAIPSSLHGYRQDLVWGLLVSQSTARTFASTSPATYNLLPSTSYFTYIDDPVVTFDPSLPDWISRYGTTIHSEDRLRDFVTDSFGRVDAQAGDTAQPITLSNTLLSDAIALHNDLDKWVAPSGVKLIQVAGWGVPTTVTGVTYKKDGTGVKSEPTFTIDGDGMVVTPSALWTSTSTGAVDYWVDLASYNSFSNRALNGRFLNTSHANIFEISSLEQFISDIITNYSGSALGYDYFSTQAPASSQLRLRYSLHSPLTLNLYDDQGRHTGVSTTTGEVVEEIPGTYYAEFGDVKYVFTDASSTAHIVMDGYAPGTFTFNVDQFAADTLTASTTFKDIPVTPQTHVTLGVQSDITTLSPMSVDENGDGVTDFNLLPKANDVVTFDTVPPTTQASTTGLLGTNGWYRGAVKVTFNATDTGSGVRSTYFSVDAVATTTGIAATVSANGTHIIRFYSDDNAGNIEQVQSALVKIDSGFPEVSVAVDATTRDLVTSGVDDLSTTTVIKTATNTSITDQAGNMTTLRFQKTYSGTFLTSARLVSIQYGTTTQIMLPSMFIYAWDIKQTLLSQILAIDNKLVVQALYDKRGNKTSIIVLKMGIPIQMRSTAGLVLLKLITVGGVAGYGW